MQAIRFEEKSEQARYEAGSLLDQVNFNRTAQRMFENEAKELEEELLHCEELLQQEEEEATVLGENDENLEQQLLKAATTLSSSEHCSASQTQQREMRLQQEAERAHTESAICIQAQVRRRQAGGGDRVTRTNRDEKIAHELHRAQTESAIMIQSHIRQHIAPSTPHDARLAREIPQGHADKHDGNGCRIHTANELDRASATVMQEIDRANAAVMQEIAYRLRRAQSRVQIRRQSSDSGGDLRAAYYALRVKRTMARYASRRTPS
jgi:hypothetical protein